MDWTRRTTTSRVHRVCPELYHASVDAWRQYRSGHQAATLPPPESLSQRAITAYVDPVVDEAVDWKARSSFLVACAQLLGQAKAHCEIHDRGSCQANHARSNHHGKPQWPSAVRWSANAWSACAPQGNDSDWDILYKLQLESDSDRQFAICLLRKRSSSSV